MMKKEGSGELSRLTMKSRELIAENCWNSYLVNAALVDTIW